MKKIAKDVFVVCRLADKPRITPFVAVYQELMTVGNYQKHIVKLLTPLEDIHFAANDGIVLDDNEVIDIGKHW